MDVFHYNEEHPVGLPKIVDAYEIGVIETCHRPRLRLERSPEDRIGTEFVRQDFDSHWTIERFLPRPIDRTHSALGDEALELVGGEKWCQLFKRRGNRFSMIGFGAHRSTCGSPVESIIARIYHQPTWIRNWTRVGYPDSLLGALACGVGFLGRAGLLDAWSAHLVRVGDKPIVMVMIDASLWSVAVPTTGLATLEKLLPVLLGRISEVWSAHGVGFLPLPAS